MGIYTAKDFQRMGEREDKTAEEVYDEFFVPFAWPGGYTLVYGAGDEYGDTDSSILCHACARDHHETTGLPVTADCHDEGPILYCDECGAEMRASYEIDPDDPHAYDSKED